MDDVNVEIYGEGSTEFKDAESAIDYIRRRTSDDTSVILSGNSTKIQKIIAAVSNKVRITIK